MTGNHPDEDHRSGLEVSRRELIQKIVVGTAFAVPIVASFDMSSLGVSSAYANNANQFPLKPPAFASASSATFTVGKSLTFAIWVTGAGPVTVSKDGKLPAGVKFTAITDNFDDNNDCNGTLSGKPSAGSGGLYPITLHASNEVKPSATQKFTVIVHEHPAFTNNGKATVHAGKEGTVKLAASGYPHATISLSGKLPAGMHFKHDQAKGTATISGKPSAKGVHKLKLTASNGVSPDATQEFVLTVAG